MIEFFNLLKEIAEGIINAIKFVIKLVSDIIYAVELVGESVLKIPDYLSFLPAAFVTVLVVIFGIVVVYKIIGREG